MASKGDGRRVKGTGGIYKRASDGMWCAAIELPSDGTKRRRKVIVRSKKADVQTELRKLHRELAKAGDLTTSAPTVSQWCDIWWKRYGMKRLKVSGRDTYQSKIKLYIKPSIGKIRLDRLTVEHVYRLHSYVTDTLKLSPGNALGAHRVLSSILTDAVREERATRNVARIAAKPGVAKVAKVVEQDFLSAAQAAQMLVHCSSQEVVDGRPGVEVAAQLATSFLLGKRSGEVVGLTRESIDLERRSIKIEWQVKRLMFEHGCGDQAKGKWPCGRKRGGDCPERHVDIPADQRVRHLSGGLYLTEPKSSTSRAELPMVDWLHDLMTAYLGSRDFAPDDLIFTRNGRPIDVTEANKSWHRVREGAGMPNVNVHSMRHTCNTVLTELKVSIDVRRAILGHASNAVNDIYTHTSDARVVAAMAELGAKLRELAPA